VYVVRGTGLRARSSIEVHEMKSRNLRLASLVVLSALVPGGIKAQKNESRPALLVSTSWLAQHISDKNLVLLHVGDRKEYDAQHIPGARFISLNDISVSDHEHPGGLMLQMQPTQVLHDKLADLGISNNSRVIVYYGNDWVTPATRVVFTLNYAGLGDNTSLLDGGMQAWKHDNHSVTDKVPEISRGTLAALTTKPIIVDAEWVKDHVGKPGISVVDGRAASYYDGTDTGGGMGVTHRTGHIAGARSVPYTEITTDDLKLKSVPELEALFAKAGVKPGDTVVGYCHIGQQATGMLFAARLTGHPVLLYDGSFEDWSAHTSYPVETKATH
jgi:thiosulfate/3-mercaptopyruvate sulfurtransferase